MPHLFLYLREGDKVQVSFWELSWGKSEITSHKINHWAWCSHGFSRLKKLCHGLIMIFPTQHPYYKYQRMAVGKDSIWVTVPGGACSSLAKVERAGTPERSSSWVLKEFLGITWWFSFSFLIYFCNSTYSVVIYFLIQSILGWLCCFIIQLTAINSFSNTDEESTRTVKILSASMKTRVQDPQFTQKSQTLIVQAQGR